MTDVTWDAARECLGEGGRLSIVLPAYNLAAVIAENVRRLHAFLSPHISFELVAVDDGSADSTAAEIARVAAELPCVVPVLLPANGGKGEALRQGLRHATGNYVLLLDADLDLLPDPIPRFFDILHHEKADIVIGSKMHPASCVSYPWHRRLASRVYYTLVKLLVRLPVHDTQTGMKLFKTEALTYAFDRMLCKRFAFDLELLAVAHQKGYAIAEAPIQLNFGSKTFGCLSPRAVRETMLDTLAIFYRIRVLDYYASLRTLAPPDPLPSVSVVIACPGPSGYLDECLRGLAAQRYPRLEVVVLPNQPFDLSRLKST
ncbi:MAG: glycosyltransferase [Kiritimatiellaeota bacterium]|nr:glycosyltransferase [Kiritimatiellota bacterium]